MPRRRPAPLPPKRCPACQQWFSPRYPISAANWAKAVACSLACAARRWVQPGEVYGRLTVVEFVDYWRGEQTRWRCRCTCGAERVVLAGTLRQGRTRSCGCLQKEVARAQLLATPAMRARWTPAQARRATAAGQRRRAERAA